MAAETELERTAQIASELIRFDTSNWGEGKARGEAEAADYVRSHLEALGLRARTLEVAPRRTSVIAHVDGRDPSRPALVVHGHLDVVPADPTDWSVDPFGGVIRDGVLWGRGAVDMKNMNAMILTALTDILESGDLPSRPLVVAFFADEENGGVFGSHPIVRDHPELFAGATEAVGEVGGYSVTFPTPAGSRRAYLLQSGEKALVWVRLVARGPAAHGSRFVSDNAVATLARAVARIADHRWPVRLTTTTRALIERLAESFDVDPGSDPDELVMRTGSAAGFLRATLRTTTNPTVLSGGYKHNVIPERAEALIDMRPFRGEEEAALAALRDIVGPDVEVEVVHQDVGLEEPFDAPIVDRMRDALERHDPDAAILPYLLSGGTDNKALSELGIAGYGFAPLRLPESLDFPAMFHGVDERVPLDALAFGRRVLADFLRNC